MIDLITQMTPFMTPIAYAGAALLVIGAVAWLLWIFTGWCTWLLRLSGRLLIVVGLFFLACEVAGIILETPWELNYSDAAQFEFKTQPFWIVGLAFFIPGFVLRLFGAVRPTH